MRRQLTGALIAVSAALSALPAQAQRAVDRPGYWGYGWDWGFGHMMFGGLMMLLFWGGLIVLIIFAVRWLGGSSNPELLPPARRTPREILEERFARGEIDKEEFEERRRLLSE